MNVHEISFENLPKAIGHLISEVEELKHLVGNVKATVPLKRRLPIDIKEACRVTGKAKPTIYSLVQKRLIPSYKNGKKLYFFEDELLEWIKNGKRKTLYEIEKEVGTNFTSRLVNTRR